MEDSPDLSGAPQWQALTLPELLTNPNSYVSGDANGRRLRIRYYHDPESNRIIGRAWFGPGAEGPPRHAHGGSIAAVLDEAMGMMALFAGYTAVAGSISVSFQKMLPLNIVVSAVTWIDRIEGKKIFTRGKLIGHNETQYANSEGIFINIGFKAISDLME